MTAKHRTGPGTALDRLVAEIRACRACVEQPIGRPLPHPPRPVVRVSPAPILVCSQAPGTRVHASGLPFDDASGDRLRDWMAVTRNEFYDPARFAFLPMAFCFPGHDANGGDLPPRRECAIAWREAMLAALPEAKLILLVGHHAQKWHLSRHFGVPWRTSLSDTVADWRRIHDDPRRSRLLPLPHPSWRNNGWLTARPWFEAELIPVLRRHVREAIDVSCPAT